MPALFRANTDLVSVAWLSSLPGLNSDMVATDLPENSNLSGATSAFVTVHTVGGTPDMYVPERQPVIQIDAWGFPANSSSRKPPWGIANSVAEIIANACYNTANFNATLTLPTNYPTARVQQAHVVSEPRRIYGDKSFYARYQMDVQLYWIELPS